MHCVALRAWRSTLGVDGADVVLIEDIEDLLDLEDVGLVEAWALVGPCVELGLRYYYWSLLVCPAHILRSILYRSDKI